METEGQEAPDLLAFMALYMTSAGDGFMGAILVTDPQGIPQEFRCTHPVRPTTIQKPLYGDALQPYVGVQLCGVPLIESMSSQPSVIVVREEFLLDLRPHSPCPVAFVRRAGEVIDVTTPTDAARAPRRTRIDCSTGKFQPIVIETHPDFPDDSSSARELLDGVFGHLDPVEPFERMETALRVLGKEDSRFQ